MVEILLPTEMLYYRRLFPISAVCGLYLYSLSMAEVARSQSITSDGTLPNPTEVNPQGNVTEITGGTARGSNLFHSFQEFSVDVGTEAFFNNADTISNILSRVTGGDTSSINGMISTNDASLFLINPAGIIFGAGASLNLGGGSFYGSTADSLLFPEGEFSAVNPDNTPVLTINAPIGLRLRDSSAPIEVTGDSATRTFVNLAVNLGQNFSLIGGEIDFNTGVAIAPSGRIELGSLSESGIVSLNEDFSINFPENVGRTDINFANAGVSVASEEGGSINLNARNINLTNDSRIVGGLVSTGINVPDAEAVDVVINATDTLSISGINTTSGLNSAIFNNIESGAVGNGGNVRISSKNLSLTNGGQIQTVVHRGNPNLELESGNGIAGDIVIDVAEAVTIEGVSEIVNVGGFDSSFPSLISSSLDLGATGASGEISIASDSLSLIDGGRILSSTFGRGNAGNITLDVSNDIKLEGANQFLTQGISNDALSSISSNVESRAEGDGGLIDIQAQNLSLTNGGQIQTVVRRGNPNLELESGNGIAGDIVIDVAEAVTIEGVSEIVNVGGFDSSFPSLISSSLDLGATGASGEISIASDSLSLIDGGRILSSTFGRGNAGNITLDVSNDIKLEGANQFLTQGISNDVLSGIFSDVASRAEGDGGSIEVTTDELSITNGAGINAGTFGEGNGGTIFVDATLITLDGTAPNGQFVSGIFNTVNQGARGNGGDIEVTTDELSITNGANINVSNLGEGNSGNLLVKADALTLNGGGIFAANIPSESNAANEASVLGGNITLEIADNLILRNNSSISAQAGENASGGNININADFVIAFSSSGDGNDIIASAEQGAGGRINISTQQIFGLEEREAVPGNGSNDIDATSDFGLDGTVNISTFTDDLLQGAAELPTNLVEPEQTITQACQSDRASGTSGTLTILGKGGVPPEPVAPLNSDVLIIEGDATTATNSAPQVIKTAQGDIVPARGVEITEDGRVLLVAYPTSNNQRTPAARTNCGK
ncbi:two-partner secretion domain-containing protein [Myxosarcina sp. GI1(2024)]